MVILIMWDMFETYSEPSDHWKLFFEITFSKTSAWKWIKIRFLAYCDFIKAINTFLSLEMKSLDTYGLNTIVYDNHNLMAFQDLYTDDIEGWSFQRSLEPDLVEICKN